MISAVIVCYNEAHHLAQSLPRLSFCDEVLLADLGSEDGSAEVARQHGARVVTHAWVPFREMIIQDLLAQASHDWVLMSDPDLLFPHGVGVRLEALIAEGTDHSLGMIYLPMVTCFGGEPLHHGQKSGRRAYRALVHRQRVELADLLHHKGVRLKEGYNALCLRPQGANDQIRHLWIDNLQDASRKAARYLPHEGRTRAALGQRFGWRRALGEMAQSLYRDLRTRAFLDRRASQVMFFQLWYVWQANMALRRFERQNRRG